MKKLLIPAAFLALIPPALAFVQAADSDAKTYREVLQGYLNQEFAVESTSGVGPVKLIYRPKRGDVSDGKIVEVGEDYIKFQFDRNPQRFFYYSSEQVVIEGKLKK